MRFCFKLCVFTLTGTLSLFISLVTREYLVASYLRYRSLNNPAAQRINAMENYQNEDYPELPPSVSDTECPPHPLSNLPRPPILATDDDILPSNNNHHHAKGAIVYLLEFIDRPLKENHREMMKFNKSLWHLWENFSQDYPHYPVYLFHEPAFTKKYRDRYSKTWPPELKIHYHEIEFRNIPSSFSNGASLENLGLNPTNRRAFPGYNNMIRFFWKDIMDLDIIVQLDYFWRLDHDSVLQSRVGVDVFHYMMKRQLKYGYRTVTTDVRHVTNGMLAFFDQYRRDPQHQSVTNGTSCAVMSQRNCLEIPETQQERNEYFPLMYYNNFEMVHVPTWRSKQMRHLTDMVDGTDMIYWNRWGDAPLRYYSINMMLDVQKEVMEWCHIRYFHHKQFEPLCNLESISYHHNPISIS
ncbi:glycolipid 2-alpha-mannosyltransferase-domain-containing protein [Phascolomyces articulosus]|uniref:Glycolipid 2-alpha-mannosyltransferase-domain-containing protein n=1 Tax=Phascolomyces articulosus TaxID=60185 RepID=A0AAD5K2C0_9FUNG|nr:glycolipid 2-alpha-mannosyltransferase-domain-containing protein [Phascolomyces articulosus]